METNDGFAAFFTHRGIFDVEDLMTDIDAILQNPESFFELTAAEREQMEHRMDEALSVL